MHVRFFHEIGLAFLRIHYTDEIKPLIKRCFGQIGVTIKITLFPEI